MPDVPDIPQGVPGFLDTFFGPRDKAYLDRIAKDTTRIRGTNCWYYAQQDMTRRIDGNAPLTDKPGLDPLIDKRARSGNVSFYGEPITIQERIDSIRCKVKPDWDYADPIMIRGVVLEPSSEEIPDERGTLFNRTLRFDFARVIADELGLRPRQGDVLRFPNLLDQYYEASDVSRDDSRFGADGFFTVYKFTLSKTSKFDARRRVLPELNSFAPSVDSAVGQGQPEEVPPNDC